nr:MULTISPECIES: hypothetical protein [Streptomyces]
MSTEPSGVDLARQALVAAREVARRNGAARKEKPKRRTGTVIRRDGREPLGLGDAISMMMTERGMVAPAVGGSVLAQFDDILAAACRNSPGARRLGGGALTAVVVQLPRHGSPALQASFAVSGQDQVVAGTLAAHLDAEAAGEQTLVLQALLIGRSEGLSAAAPLAHAGLPVGAAKVRSHRLVVALALAEAVQLVREEGEQHLVTGAGEALPDQREGCAL